VLNNAILFFSDFAPNPPEQKTGGMFKLFQSIGKYKQGKDQEKNWQVVYSTIFFLFFLFFFIQSSAISLWEGPNLSELLVHSALRGF
jgi:hypothetical protein